MVSRFVAPEFSKAMWRKQQQPGPAFSVQGSQRLRLKLDKQTTQVVPERDVRDRYVADLVAFGEDR